MSTTTLRLGFLTLAATGLMLSPSAAGADGLPVPVETSNSGVQTPGGGPRHFSVPTERGSVVMRLDDEGSEIMAQRFIPTAGAKALPFVIPAVAVDGTVGGLSADGNTLALIEPRRGFPRRTTRFVLLDAVRFKIVDRIALEGDFSFDAISRDGSTIYLTHYLDRRDPTRYEVRAYDVDSGRLADEPIVDSRVVEIQMRGFPLTRATSPDGSWEYTAYDGNSKTPFVHALNVDEGRALCIDLSEYLGRRALPPTLTLDPSGTTLTVTSRQGDPVAAMDTESFEVTGLRHAQGGAAEPTQAETSDPSTWLLGIPVALVAALGAVLLLRRRRRPDAALLSNLDFDPAETPRTEGDEDQDEVLTKPGSSTGPR